MKGCCWIRWPGSTQGLCSNYTLLTLLRGVQAQVHERRVRLNNSSDNAYTGCEIGCLYRVARLRLWECLHFDRSQVRYFGHVIQMPPEILTGKVFWTCPSGGDTLERSSLSASLEKPWDSPSETSGNG